VIRIPLPDEFTPVWLLLIASMVLTVIALVKRSGALFLWAALCSGVFSFLGLWSVGPFTALLTFLQLACAAGIYLRARWWMWLLFWAVAIMCWLRVALYFSPLMRDFLS